MPIYSTSGQLYSVLYQLFNKLQEDPNAVRSVIASRMIIRLSLIDPTAEVTINGRQAPVKVQLSSSTERPDLDVALPADKFHHILMGELSLRKVLASGQMNVKGPLWKTFALQEILQQGRALYPSIFAREFGQGGLRA